MQYILSVDEYKQLKTSAAIARSANKQTIQTLCTMVADNMPIKYWGREEASIWGCTLSDDRCYCDECPVQKMCPNEHKRWSK